MFHKYQPYFLSELYWGLIIGLLSIIIYVTAGLIGIPVFASGGGINYYSQLGFGYILGYFAGIYLVGNILAVKVTNYSIFRAAIIGVFVIHLFGIIYLSCLLLIQHNSIFAVFGWIWAQSGMQIPYDLLVSFIAICLARPVRSILWFAMD